MRHSIHYLEVLRRADALFQEGDVATEDGLKLFEESWDNIRRAQAEVQGYSS